MPYIADPTHYEILGVDPKASAEQIKTAWLRAAKTLHPDVDGGNAAMFVIAQKAYETLSDPFLRADYDRQVADAPRVDDEAPPRPEPPPPVDEPPERPASDPSPRPPATGTHQSGCRRRAKPRRGARLADDLFRIAWLALGLLVSFRNMALVLERRPASVRLLAVAEHFGIALGVFAGSAVGFLVLMPLLGRARWIYRSAAGAAVFVFPYWLWSPLAVVGLWVAYEGFRLLVWPPPTARVRSWFSRERAGATRRSG